MSVIKFVTKWYELVKCLVASFYIWKKCKSKVAYSQKMLSFMKGIRPTLEYWCKDAPVCCKSSPYFCVYLWLHKNLKIPKNGIVDGICIDTD